MRRPRGEVKTTTVEGFLRDNREDRGGPHGQPPSLWDHFNDIVSDMTSGMRRKARNIVRDRLQSGTLSKEQEQQLHSHFNDIVDGGVKGALRAAHTLLSTPKPA